MNRLPFELSRLYLPRSQPAGFETAQPQALVGPADTVRAMVMELTRPPSWEVLSRVWHGVQNELALPAPAIAVSGIDGLQLWFSLDEAIGVSQAQAFLEGLRLRFLPDIEADRVRLMPAPGASALHPERHARRVPALQASTGNWSAFVASDLAPIFSETPWLDIPPNEEGQAALLRGLAMIEPRAFDAAVKRLATSVEASLPSAALAAVAGVARVATLVAGGEGPLTPARAVGALAGEAPESFLRRVMNDESVALALRIEAAKALLPHSKDPRSPPGG